MPLSGWTANWTPVRTLSVTRAAEQVPSTHGEVDLERHHLVRADRQFSAPESLSAARSPSARARHFDEASKRGHTSLLRTASRTLSIPLLRRRRRRAGHAAGVNPTSLSVRSQMRRWSRVSSIAGTGGSSLMPGVVV